MNESKSQKTLEQKILGLETRQKEAKLIKDKIEAEGLAYKSEAQGQFLAGHVLGMLENGKTEDRAKVGRFTKRYPYDMDQETVTLATNASLKEREADIKVDVYNSAYDGVENRVAVTKIDGEDVPTSELYNLWKK